MNTIEDIYRNLFYKYLDSIINFSLFDKKINESGLFFGKSNDIQKNISSDYFSVLNNFFVEKLTENDKRNLVTNSINIIKTTYKEILKRDNQDMIMYNPPLPEHNVKNGTLVLEFVYGKNTAKIPDSQYSVLIKRQKEFIKEISVELKEEIKTKLGLDCEIFINKRIKKYEYH